MQRAEIESLFEATIAQGEHHVQGTVADTPGGVCWLRAWNDRERDSKRNDYPDLFRITVAAAICPVTHSRRPISGARRSGLPAISSAYHQTATALPARAIRR
ncbi:hypothetical protein ACVWZ0_003200 [Erwinia sp. TECH1]